MSTNLKIARKAKAGDILILGRSNSCTDYIGTEALVLRDQSDIYEAPFVRLIKGYRVGVEGRIGGFQYTFKDNDWDE